MIYALNELNEKIYAQPKMRARCLCCNEEVLAKCGSIKVWHWSHKANSECDYWYEPMTEWHQKWQSIFPKEFREIVLFDDITKEKHIADIRLPNELVLEFQHSKIDILEFIKRTEFYKKIIWILDGKNFLTKDFKIIHEKERHPYYLIEILNSWQYPKEILNDLEMSILKLTNNISVYKDNGSSFNLSFKYNVNPTDKIDNIKNQIELLIYDIYEKYDFPIKAIKIDSISYKPETFKMIYAKVREIYSEFSKTNVFIDNLEGYDEYLFYWNKSKMIKKTDFIKKYTNGLFQ